MDTTVDVTLSLDEITAINQMFQVMKIHDLLCTEHDDCVLKDQQLFDKFNHLQESLVREFGEL